jgi:hypothetical protein
MIVALAKICDTFIEFNKMKYKYNQQNKIKGVISD